jgi:peptidoglycan/LPS O-acetylase OafA/YrhL
MSGPIVEPHKPDPHAQTSTPDLAEPLRDLERPIRGHIVELDSLRGLAAVFVLLDHFLRIWRESSTPALAWRLIHIPFLSNGKAAVMMFFALSGFVLTLPFLKGKGQSYPIYAARRICRIYIPYAVALLLALAGCWGFHGRQTMYAEFRPTWAAWPSGALIGQHLLFLGKFNVYALNPPIWSLVHEMRISLVFPLLCLIALRLPGGVAFLAALAFPVAATLLQRASGTPAVDTTGPEVVAWLKTLGFCGTFVLGSILARHHEAIRAGLLRTPRVFRWMLVPVALALYQYASKLPASWHMRGFLHGIGASYIILLALTHRSAFSRFLQMGPLLFLGRISYSLYLVHVPILMILSITLFGKISYGYLLLPFMAIALIAATVFHRLVEVPSIRLGKTIGAGKTRVRAVESVA